MGGRYLVKFPIIYEQNATDFFSLGLGVLTNAIRAEVTEERNGSFFFEGTFLTDDELFPLIKENRILRMDAGHTLKDQRFRIKRIVPKHDNTALVYAEHISYVTQELSLKPQVFIEDRDGSGALDIWKKAILDTNDLRVSSDVRTTGKTSWHIKEVSNAREALGGVRGSILDVWGGEYRFDNYHISLLTKRGKTQATMLAYGRNIIDFEQERNIMDTFTSVYPYATYTDENQKEHLVTVDKYIIDSEHASKFPNRKALPIDFSSEFDDKNKPDAKKLKSLAEKYIKNNEVGVPKTSIKLKFVDLSKTLEYKDIAPLEQLSLCDEVNVHYEKLGVNTTAKVVKTVWNVIDESYTEILIGEKRVSLSESIISKDQEIKTQINDMKSDVNYSLLAANGKNTIFYGLYGEDGKGEPKATMVGDMWYKPNGEDTEFYIWNGTIWEFIMTTGENKIIKNEIEKLEQTSKDISESVDKALEEAEKSLELAGQARETAFNSENVSMKVKADLGNLDYKTNNYVLESSDEWKKIVLNDDIETTIVTVHYKTEKEIIKTEKKELELSSSYIFKAKLFEGYTLSDTAEKKLTVTEDLVVIFMYTEDKKETTVTVIHKTEDEVLKEDKKTLFVGDNHVFMSSEFDGYVLKGDKTQTITVVEDLVVTFLYEKKKVIEYTEVQVEYIDREKNRLIDRETLTLEIDTTYTFEHKEIEGYTLDDEASKTKTISKDLTVHFYYKEIKKISEVTVNYIDQKANAVIKAETKQLETGSEHVFEAKKIEGYVLVSDYEQRKIISDNLAVNFYYEPEIVVEEATVIVRYVSTSTGETLHTFTIESEVGKTIDIVYKSVDGLELKDDYSKRVEVIENNQVVIFYVEKEQVNLLIDDYEIKSIANQRNGYQYSGLWEYTNGSLANTAEPGDKLILSYLVTGDVPKNPSYFMIQSDGNVPLSSWLPFGEMESGKRYEISFDFKSEYARQTDSKKIGLLSTSFASGEVLKVSEPKLMVLKAPKKMQFRSSIAPSLSKSMLRNLSTVGSKSMLRNVPTVDSKSMLRNVSTVDSKHMLRNVSTVEFDEKSGESKKIAEIDILPLNNTLLSSETLTSVLVDASSDCTIVLGQENAIGKEEFFEGGVVLKEGFLECICNIKQDTHKINIYIKNSTGKRNVVKYKNLQLQKGNIRLAWSPASKDIVLNGKFTTFEESVDGFRRTVVDEQAGIKSEQSQMYNQINMSVKRVDGLSSDVTILSNQINLKVDKREFDSLGNTISKQQSQIKLLSDNIDLKVSSNEVVSRINMSPERIRIDSKLIHLSGTSLIDNAVIKSAMIDTVNANSITTGTLNGANVNVIYLNAANITTGFLNTDRIRARSIRADHLEADAVTVGFNTSSTSIKLYGDRIEYRSGNTLTGRITSEGQEFWYGSREIGYTGGTYKAGNTNVRGIGHQLEFQGDFVSWSYRKNRSDSHYTSSMSLDPRGALTGDKGIILHEDVFFKGDIGVAGSASGKLRFGTTHYAGNVYPSLVRDNGEVGIVFGSGELYLLAFNKITALSRLLK